MEYMDAIHGYRIVESMLCTERKQMQFLRCNKKKWKRIKKFRKDPKNFKEGPMDSVYLMDKNTIVCHPVIAKALRNESNKIKNLERNSLI